MGRLTGWSLGMPARSPIILVSLEGAPMGWWRALRLAKCLGHVRGGLLVATAAVVVLAGAPAASASGSMRYVTFQRPAGSACGTGTGTIAAATGTGIGWDGARVLGNCWAGE